MRAILFTDLSSLWTYRNGALHFGQAATFLPDDTPYLDTVPARFIEILGFLLPHPPHAMALSFSCN